MNTTSVVTLLRVFDSEGFLLNHNCCTAGKKKKSEISYVTLPAFQSFFIYILNTRKLRAEVDVLKMRI